MNVICRTLVLVAAAIPIAMGFGATAWAAPPKTATVINTKKMCPVCAKKIADKLSKIEGVADARAEVESKTLVVVPVVGRELSPRAIWEAVELGGEQPIRLTGPSGTFVAKPKS